MHRIARNIGLAVLGTASGTELRLQIVNLRKEGEKVYFMLSKRCFSLSHRKT